MGNALTKDLEIMFENLIEGFDAACVMSRAVDTSYPDPKAMQRANDTFYRPQNYRTSIVTGVDISGQSDTDIIQRQVPTTFRTPDNVRYKGFFSWFMDGSSKVYVQLLHVLGCSSCTCHVHVLHGCSSCTCWLEPQNGINVQAIFDCETVPARLLSNL